MSRRRVRLRRLTATVVALAATAGVAAGAVAGAADDRADPTSPGASPAGGAAAPATAGVTRRDLTEREQLDGTLGYGEARAVRIGERGTLTALAAEGSVVDRGGVLAEVDGRPVVLLFGQRPQWRALGPGSEDGSDIRQVEENLVALGYATAEEVGVDDEWTRATTRAVKDWQEALGVERTGRLELGSVVFQAGPVRVARHLLTLGAAAGVDGMEVTGTAQVVTVDLAADRDGLLSVGQAVEVELPDGTITAGTVAVVSSTIDPPAQEGGEATRAVTVTLDDTSSVGPLDGAPVEVAVVTVAASAVLTVPVDALMALAEGGYALERPDGRLIGVELGAFADGFVEVTATTGALVEGDAVVVPS